MKRTAPDDMMERTKATVALVNAVQSKDFEFEAFMALFHPGIQQDKRKMVQLRQARRES